MGEVTEIPDSFVERSHIRAVVRDEIMAFANGFLAEAIGMAISKVRAEIEGGFQDAMREFSYKGNWSEGVLYRRGNFVSVGGQVFHCDRDCKDMRPGADNVNWSLAVKSGRDGRDGRDLAPPETPEQRTAHTHRDQAQTMRAVRSNR